MDYMRGVNFVLSTPKSTMNSLKSYANGNFHAVDLAICTVTQDASVSIITPVEVAKAVDRLIGPTDRDQYIQPNDQRYEHTVGSRYAVDGGNGSGIGIVGLLTQRWKANHELLWFLQ